MAELAGGSTRSRVTRSRHRREQSRGRALEDTALRMCSSVPRQSVQAHAVTAATEPAASLTLTVCQRFQVQPS
jgi:hypothetical protein